MIEYAFSEIVKPDDETNNVTENIFNKIGVNLHQKPSHPLGILKNSIYQYFDQTFSSEFEKIDDIVPVVSTKMNFDEV